LAQVDGGGHNTTTYTTSTKNIYETTYVPVSQSVDQYSTEIKALLNGSTVVYDQTLTLAFADPAVQAAVQAALAALAANNADLGAPVLTAPTTSLLSSVTADADPLVTTNVSFATTLYIGPQTIMIGDNQSQLFPIPPGSQDFDTLVTSDISSLINVVTTNTYLTTQSYLLDGITAPISSVPETGSTLLLFSGSLAALGWLVRRKLPAMPQQFS
jgi:hypothetical protein